MEAGEIQNAFISHPSTHSGRAELGYNCSQLNPLAPHAHEKARHEEDSSTMREVGKLCVLKESAALVLKCQIGGNFDLPHMDEALKELIDGFFQVASIKCDAKSTGHDANRP